MRTETRERLRIRMGKLRVSDHNCAGDKGKDEGDLLAYTRELGLMIRAILNWHLNTYKRKCTRTIIVVNLTKVNVLCEVDRTVLDRRTNMTKI